MEMKISGEVIEKIYGIALVALCGAFAIFSTKACDGDITPVFVLAPIGVCSMMKMTRRVNG